jgi:hypothetical protein
MCYLALYTEETSRNEYKQKRRNEGRKKGENIFKLGNEFDKPKLCDEKIGRRANFRYVKNGRTDTEWENEEKRK